MMLGLVFGIVGAIVTVVWRTIRREERERKKGEKDKDEGPPDP